jgi:hypothetical protein
MRRSHHRVVHDDISARLYNFDARNPSVGLDTNLKGANEGLGRVENRCRLIPLAVKAVMDERVIPPEVGGSSASAGLPAAPPLDCPEPAPTAFAALTVGAAEACPADEPFSFGDLSALGLAFGDAFAFGLFFGEADGLGVALGEGLGLGVGFGVGFGVGVGVGFGFGVGVGVG